jgi:hypothetical protein
MRSKVAAMNFLIVSLYIGLSAIAGDYPASLLFAKLSSGERFIAKRASTLRTLAALLLLAFDAPVLASIYFAFTHRCIIGCYRGPVERVLNFIASK